MPKLRPLLSAVVPTLFLGGFASAEMLPPGGLTDNFATSLANDPKFGGEVDATQVIPFSLSDDQGNIFYVGQIEHNVVRDANDNTLSFYYKFVNSPNSAVLGVEDLIAGQFKGYSTDVALLTDVPGDSGPIDALRSDDGSSVTFDFDATSSRIDVGDSSFTFLVKTNATNFDDKGSANIRAFVAQSIDEGSPLLAGGVASISTFRPIGSPVPAVAPPPVTISVPLPPAMWAGLPVMIAAMGYVRRLRMRPIEM